MENSTTNGMTDLIGTATSLTQGKIFIIVVLCIIFLLGITANGLVIYVTGFKMKTTLNSLWFLNLALADFCCIFTVIFNVIILFLNFKCPFGNFWCKFITLVQEMSAFASILLLTAISVDRCLTVWAAVWARNKRTPHKARLICAFVWLTSMVCCIPFALYNTAVNERCVESKYALTNKQLAILRFVIVFLIPFLIITCCYVAIGVRANQIKREKKIRPFLIILAVILSFFIFWLPIHIIRLIITDQRYKHSINPQSFNSHVITMALKMSWVSYILALLHSCLNPFLYMFMCEDFKQKLKRSVFLVLEHTFAE